MSGVEFDQVYLSFFWLKVKKQFFMPPLTSTNVHLTSFRSEVAVLPGRNGAAWWARWKDFEEKIISRIETEFGNLSQGFSGELCSNKRRERGRLLLVQVRDFVPRVMVVLVMIMCMLVFISRVLLVINTGQVVLVVLEVEMKSSVCFRYFKTCFWPSRIRTKNLALIRRKLDSSHCNTRMRIRITPHNSRWGEKGGKRREQISEISFWFWNTAQKYDAHRSRPSWRGWSLLLISPYFV